MTPPDDDEPVAVVQGAGEGDDASVGGPAGATGRRSRKSSPLRTIVEWALVLGGALLVALLIRTFALSAFYIPSGSMEPTLAVSDRVLVNKLSYHLHDVNRGDVVVFERPPGEVDSEIKDLIKRVIALPGESVQGLDGTVYVCEQACAQPAQQGRPLTESYVNPACTSRGYGNTTDFAPVTLTDDEVWVMGDNRCDSSDSRVFGPIDEDTIVGRAFVVVLPFGHWRWL